MKAGTQGEGRAAAGVVRFIRLAGGRPITLCLLLFVLVVWVFLPSLRNGFVNFDDPVYVTQNHHVRAGLTWSGLAWAFGRLHGEQTYWHPLTWVSHMLDCQLFGLKPWGHHLTNVVLHAVNTVLVFLVFRRMTGACGRCVVLAALFALHPLQVDTVAWVAERKNLLSAFFWLLTLWAYVRYAEYRMQNAECGMQNPASSNAQHATRNTQHASRFTFHVSRFTHHALPFYLLALLFFGLGLMCKPVLVTLPFVLLLLDYWPLQRLQLSTLTAQPSILRRLVGEKTPFFLLAAGSSLITILAHRELGSLDFTGRLTVGLRLETALVSYVRYLGKTIWPSRLAVFYPYPTGWPVGKVVICGIVLLALCALALRAASSRPWLFLGWFWFLGVLVPFIGLVQAGAQAMADRFAYVPLIGLLLLLIWGAHELTQRWPYAGIIRLVAATAAGVLCLALTRQQIGRWRDGETLFRHAIMVTGDNYLAQNNLGSALLERGQVDEAIAHLREAIKADPAYATAHSNLGAALVKKGQAEEAIGCLREALRLNPKLAEAHCNLGVALDRQGRPEEAVSQLNEAVKLAPEDAHPHYSLGAVLVKKGEAEGAIRQFQAALKLEPDYAEAHRDLGIVLGGQGRLDEAIGHLSKALTLTPGDAETHCGLGVTLGRQGRLDEAIGQFEEALKVNPNQAEAHCGLGTALSRKMRLDDAIGHLNEALRLNPDYAEAHCNLGVALGKQGRLDEAIRHLREAVRLKPGYAEAQNNLRTALNVKAAATAPDTAPQR